MPGRGSRRCAGWPAGSFRWCTRVLASVEAALEPFAARPHWGKLFLADGAAIGGLYERLGDFAALLDRIDPRGAFAPRG